MLHKLQKAFSAAMIAPQKDPERIMDDGATATIAAIVTDTAEAHIKPGKLSATQCLAIYRHHVHSNLQGALRDIYPVCQRILGTAQFDDTASEFITTHPSSSGDLNDFGAEWGEFLNDHQLGQTLPYLSDIARLEWAWHRAFHAPDPVLFDVSRLARVAPERVDRLMFILHPSVYLIKSDYPLLTIWKVNQPGYNGSMAINWESGGDTIQLAREGYNVILQRCTAPTYLFLTALQQGKNLNAAVEAVMTTHQASDFNLQNELAMLIQSGIIIDFMDFAEESI